jgi:hypothetical protein
MSSAEDLWEWIREPLDGLRRDLEDEPDKSWDARRTELLDRLGLRDPDEYPMLKELFERLDEVDDDERANLIRSGELDSVAYELTQKHGAVQADDQAPAESGYDEQEWFAYLAENGPAWDGTEESWGQFREWFTFYAGERGLGEPARALVEHLDGQPAAERIATFAQYGVIIGPQGSAGAGGEAAATWDEGWGMLFRVGPGGAYEFAYSDDQRTVRPGTDWMSQEEVLASRDATGGEGTETEASEVPAAVDEVMSELAGDPGAMAARLGISEEQAAQLATDPEFQEMVAAAYARASS